MLKKFFKDSVYYGTANFLSRALGLLLVPIYSRIFSPADFGVIDILLMLGTLINLVAPLEISQAVARFYAEAGSDEDRMGLMVVGWWYTVLSLSIIVLITFLFKSSLASVALDIQHAHVILWASFFYFAYGLYYYLSNQLRWRLMSKQYTISIIITNVVVFLTTFYLLTVRELYFEGYFGGLIAGHLAGVIYILWMQRDIRWQKINWAKLRPMIMFSIPLVLSSLGVFLSLYVDRIFIQRMLSLHEVGLYGIGYRFASVAGLIIVGFQSALTPLIYQHYREPETPRKLSRIFRFFCLIVLFVISGLILFSKEILIVFSTPSYYEGHSLIPIIAASIALSSMYIFAAGLMIAKKTKIIMGISLLTAILNVLGNLILIPVWGVLGAGVATCFSALFGFFCQMKMAHRFYDVPYDGLRVVVVSVVAIGIGYITLQLVDLFSITTWYTVVLLKALVLIFIVCYMIYFLVDFRSVREFLVERVLITKNKLHF